MFILTLKWANFASTILLAVLIDLIILSLIFVYFDINSTFFSSSSAVNPDTYAIDVSMRAMSLMFQTILHDEEVQVGGVTVIIDHAGLTWNHAKLLTIFELREILGSYKVTPLRVKDVLIVNMPPFLHRVAEILDPFICHMFNMEKRQVFLEKN